jgi:DNA-directed RNA polymerase specialized sigma24 family protein
MPVTVTYDTFGAVFRTPQLRLAWLHEQWGPRLARLIWNVTWGLILPEDLQDAYQETMRAFWTRLCTEEVPAHEYWPQLQAIARHKGLDAMRRRRCRPSTNSEETLAMLEDPYRHDARGLDGWPRLVPAECEEFRAVLAATVAALPPRQRLVAEVYLEHCAEFGPRDIYDHLTALVGRRTGQPEKVETIKSLWHAARKAIAAGLARRGYAPIDDQPRL